MIKPSDETVKFSRNDRHGSLSQIDVLLTINLEYIPRIALPDLSAVNICYPSNAEI